MGLVRNGGSGRHSFRHSGRGRSPRPSPETLTGIGAILTLVLATSVYAVGQAAVPSNATYSAPRPAGATAVAPAPPGPTTLSVQPAAPTAGTAPTSAVQSAAAVTGAPSPSSPAAPPPVPAENPEIQKAPETGAPEAGAPATGAPLGAAAAVALTPSIGPDLDAKLNGIIRAYPGYQLGVALIDVADGVVHEYGVRTKFTAASTAKVLAAAAYYPLAETGELSLAAPMGASTAGLQIRQMIQQSDNESWAMILEALGSRRLTDYAASIGIAYDRGYNKLTPAETARTLSLLYTGQLLNAPNTAQLLSYMQNTNLETLIPAALPPDVVVFHKYGLLYGNLHDASLLVRGGKAYAFVVYTLGRSPAEMTSRTRIIHLLTRAVSAALFPG